MQEIKNEEICVVIQGPIVGKPTDKLKDRHTLLSIRSVRKYLPGAEIVLSTWEGSDCSDLPYDKVVLSKDPGSFNMILENGEMWISNPNRQIVSTLSGLKECRRKYVLKMRSDVVLTGNDFLSFFLSYSCRSTEMCFLNMKVLALPPRNPKRKPYFPFCVTDWHFFGLLDDVIDIWDIPLIKESDLIKNKKGQYPVNLNLGTEQYIWLSFLKKHGKFFYKPSNKYLHKITEISDRSLVNNLIFLNHRQMCIKSLKYGIDTKYTTNSYKRMILYTHNDYIKLYNRYCGTSVPIEQASIKDILDYILSALYLWSEPAKDYIRAQHPHTFKVLKNIMRKLIG